MYPDSPLRKLELACNKYLSFVVSVVGGRYWSPRQQSKRGMGPIFNLTGGFTAFK
jgi:hypothetical protein